MARLYTVQFNQVAVSAVQDLFGLYVPSTMAIQIHQVSLGQTTSASVGNLAVSLRRLTTTVTQGSGGTVPTPQKLTFGDPASVVTAHVNDTSQASSSGSNIVLYTDYYNVINGWLWLPAPDDRPIITLSQAFIVSLDQAPGSAETTSGTIVYAEIL